MAMIDQPAWADYKASLARIAQAGARLTRAQAENGATFAAAEREFFDALHAYDVARERAASALSNRPEGVVLPFLHKPVSQGIPCL